MEKFKILAVASAGGHWKQLIILSKAFQREDTYFVTTLAGLPEEQKITKFAIVKDSNQNDKLALIITFFQLIRIIIKVSPKTIVTTGAAPGLLALLIGKLFNKKTIWIDSIANSEEMSLGGRIAKKFADVVITQWDNLADGEKVIFKGAIF